MRKILFNIFKFIRNTRRKAIIIGLIIIVTLSSISLLVLNWPKPSKAAWFDDTFLYRQKSTVTNSGSLQTNFQVSIAMDTATLITAGKMQSDCDDIRVTDANGALLFHELEEGSAPCNNAATKIWVKIPSIPTTAQILYVYYGNSSAASVENGRVVFDFYDDFSAATLNSTTWTATGAASISSGALAITTGSVYSNGAILPSSTNYMYEYRPKWASTVVAYSGLELNNTSNGSGGNTDADKVIYMMTNNVTSIAQLGFANDTGTSYNLALNMALYTPTADTYYVDGFSMDGTEIKYWNNGSQVGTTATGTWTGAPAPYMYMGYFLGSDSTTTNITDITIDWVRVRKYAATAPAASTAGSEEKGTGPVAYWKMDEGTDNTCSGGTNDACDTMGKEDTVFGATTAAPTWKSEDMCVSGKCLLFDGSNDYANSASTIDFGVKVVTVSFWLKWNVYETNDDAAMELSTNMNSNDGAFSFVPSSSDGNWSVYIQDSTSGFLYRHEEFSRPSAGVWHHFAIVLDNSTAEGDIRPYVDGVLQPTNIILNNKDQSSNIKTDTLYFMSRGGASLFGNGFLDDVKIYPYERTAAQIKTDYASLGVSEGTGAVLGTNAQNNPALSSGLVGYWKMDEASGNATDYSGYGTTLTDTNTVARGAGKFGNGGDFEAGSSEYFLAADNAALSVTGSLTVSAWIKIESASSYDIISKADNLGRDSYHFRLISDEIRLTLIDSSDVVSTTTTDARNLATATWYHVAGVYNQSERIVKIYVNGEATAATTTGTVPTALEDNDGRFHIGAQGSTGTPFGFFDGIIDEARVYNRALNGAEIQTLYNWAPGPSGYWKFNENTGTTSSYDSSGNSLTASITAMSVDDWVPGKYGSALDYNGTDDVASVSYNTLLDTGMPALTVEAWVNPGACEEDDAVVKKDLSYILRITSTCQIETYTWATTDANELDSTTTIATSTWSHVTLVYDGTSQIIYINGIKEATTDPQTGTIDISASETVTIGASDAGAEEITGKIDEVKIYNYARNSKQIVEDMNAGHPTGGSPIASQVGYWSFDEQQGQTANDKGFGNNDGTLGADATASTDDPTWKTANSSSCKINGCSSFDGADYITIGDVDELETHLNEGFSISTWAKSSDWVDSGPEVLVAKWAGDADGDFYLGVYQNKARALINGLNGGVTGKVTNSTTNLTNGAWTHLVMTWSGGASDPILLYVNGQLDMTIESNNTLATIADSAEPIFIGARTNAAKTAFFNGQIDEAKIYNGALTPSEVLIDYNAGSAISLGGVLGTQDNEGFGGNPPVGFWKLDENKDNTCSGGTNDTCDSSGNGSDLAFASGPAWIPGKIGAGVSFDGTDDILEGTTASSVNSLTTLTVTAWFYEESAGGGSFGRIFRKGDNATPTASDVYFELNAGVTSDLQWRAGYATTGVWNSACDGATVNQWHHVAVVYTHGDVNQDPAFYYDGVPCTVSEATTPVGATNSDSTTIAIGDWGDGTRAWDGIIDNVKIFNYHLTQSQISYDYNRGAPIALYKLDECQGTTAYNSAPAASGIAAGNNGTITPGAGSNTTAGTCGSGTTSEMWDDGTTGKRNASLGFDGTDDYISMGNVTSFNTANLTWSAWVKTTNDAPMDIFANSDSTANADYLTLCLGDGCTSVLTNELITIVHNAGDARTGYTTTTRTELFDGNWHHIAMTADGSIYKLYLDGRLLDLTTGQGSNDGTTTVASYSMTTIGALDRLAVGAFMNGQIDDARIYNYALTQNQIKQVINNGAQFFGPSTGNP